MSHRLYDILDMLDAARLSYRLDRTQPNAVLIMVTAVTERFEISVFADGDVELSRFLGTEDVIPGLEAVRAVIASHKDDEDSN
jgi:hypothetical protein